MAINDRRHTQSVNEKSPTSHSLNIMVQNNISQFCVFCGENFPQTIKILHAQKYQ